MAIGVAEDEEMLDVESAGDGAHGSGLLASSSPGIGEQETNGDARAANQNGTAGRLPEGRLSYTIKDQTFTAFTGFIEALRGILANHQDREDICDRHEDTNLSSSKSHPLLAKPRADQQPARWTQVKLQVKDHKGKTSSTTTLVIRDDNVDVVGFSNHKGDWHELGNNRCMLPPDYNSVLPLNWGNSYKSILDVANEDEVTNKLESEGLGKTFAINAVRVLSCYPHEVDGPSRLAVVGLMFMISESAKMNPVHDAITRGWDTGRVFTKELMTNYVWKYVEMSRCLRYWKEGNYAEPQPNRELRAIYLVLNGNCEVAYTIGDRTSYDSFMRALRLKLAEHPDGEDILDLHNDQDLRSTKNHPVLAKQRADGEQPARWIEVELQVVNDRDEMTWTILVIRDDNMDIMGFMNQNGAWYELGNRRVLPPGYRSKLLGWGNSYKSILGVRNEEEVMDRLMSANLGKKFATSAVHLLSRFDPKAKDVYSLRLHLVGLMFMVSESARLNHVHKAIADGWDTGKGFTKELRTNYVWKWKYVEMSRRLRHWKKGDYAQPKPKLELDAIYLVLNEEYIMGDLLSFAYPEVLMLSFPEMFKEMFLVPYTVKVKLRRVKTNNEAISIVCGQIMAFICDEHRHSVPFRAGSMVFIERTTEKKKTAQPAVVVSEGCLVLESSVVVVPSGWVPRIDVDLQIKISERNNDKLLKATFIFDKEAALSQSQTPKDTGIEVEVRITPVEDYMQDFPAQLSRSVEVQMVSGHRTIVYTIGDEISFTEFIMVVRRILADHPGREDILDGHDFLNLSSTREHPLLPKMRPEQPARWIHIKLQVVENNETCWTTLVMRDDDLYVYGFQNQQGATYELVEDDDTTTNMLPREEYSPRPLGLDVTYRSLLGARDGNEVISKLTGAKLGRDFAVKAVRVLSTSEAPGMNLSVVGEALAGLIVLICESARMNPIHNSFATGGWSDGTGFTGQLMRRCVWEWGSMSRKLREWKTRKYDAPQGVVYEVQATYLVRNDRQLPRQRAGGPAGNKTGTPSGGGDQSKDSASSSRRVDSNGPPGAGGEGDDRMAPRPSQDKNDPGESSQPVDADDDALGHGRARVELLGLAMHPDLLVDGMKIVVFDGKRGQIIYRKDEQGHQEEKGQGGQGMVDLVLTGPYRGISAEYGCFAIKIDIPRMPSSSSWSAHRAIRWEWDCDDSNCAEQVDTVQPAYDTIRTPDSHEVGKVTYAVMSNALEASVQIMLRLKDGRIPYGAQGKITARIEGFQVGSVLFSRAEGMGQCFSPTDDMRFRLQLARNMVAVPCGRMLQIEVDLHTKILDSKDVKHLNVTLKYANGTPSQCHEIDGGEVEVNIAWYPEPEVNIKPVGQQEFDGAALKLSGREDVSHEEIRKQEEPSHPANAPTTHSPIQVCQVGQLDQFTLSRDFISITACSLESLTFSGGNTSVWKAGING